MIHIDDGVLRAYLDDELPSSEAAAIRSHVLDCPACTARRNELGDAAGVVSSALALLPDRAPPAEAWA
ncbi:MAG: anti-sigma factor, partial [Gemmatimonadetes bacterium]|nr:anti-sigma factor [Gemmatimonadota bacterium]